MDGICVGIGMVFDLVFYYYCLVNVYVVYGYGLVFWVGVEMINLLNK